MKPREGQVLCRWGSCGQPAVGGVDWRPTPVCQKHAESATAHGGATYVHYDEMVKTTHHDLSKEIPGWSLKPFTSQPPLSV